MAGILGAAASPGRACPSDLGRSSSPRWRADSRRRWESLSQRRADTRSPEVWPGTPGEGEFAGKAVGITQRGPRRNGWQVERSGLGTDRCVRPSLGRHRPGTSCDPRPRFEDGGWCPRRPRHRRASRRADPPPRRASRHAGRVRLHDEARHPADAAEREPARAEVRGEGGEQELARQKSPAVNPRLTPHSLRHTFASILLEAGASVPYVMGQLGHADPKVTLTIYAHVLGRRQRGEAGRAADLLSGSGISANTPTIEPLVE